MSQLWQDAVAYAAVLLDKPLPSWLSQEIALHQEDDARFVAITTNKARLDFISQTLLGPLTEGLRAATGDNHAALRVACREGDPHDHPPPPPQADEHATTASDPLDAGLQPLVDAVRSHHPTLYRNWFSDLTPAGREGGVVAIRAPARPHAAYLQRHCTDAFNDALRSVTGRLLAVRFLEPDEQTPAPRRPVATPSATPGSPADRPSEHPDAPDTLIINPDYTFEHFVLGPNNRLAHAAALAVANNPGRAYNPLFIHGGVGLGKTHLLQSICVKVLARQPRPFVHSVSCDRFMTRFMSAVQSGRMDEFRHAFRDVDLLVIDDIHFLAKRDRTQEEFFHTFNSLYQAGKQIVLSSDAPPDEIPDLEARLVSRFNWGLVCEINKPGYETHAEIVRRKASERGVDLPGDVADEIARHVDSNIRELEGAVTRLQIISTLENQPVSLALAHKALEGVIQRPTKMPTAHEILQATADFYGVRIADMLGRKRARSVTLPRQVGMYLAREMTNHSLVEIGGLFGGRDHTVVMHAVSSIRRRRETDDELDSQIRTLLQGFPDAQSRKRTETLSDGENQRRLGVIVSRACDAYEVDPEDLTQSTSPRVIAARDAISWLARRHTSLSFPAIAHRLGKSSHSTIITAAKRAETIAATDTKLLELQEFCSNAFG